MSTDLTAVWDMPAAVEAFVSLGLWGDLRGVGACQALGYADRTGLVAGILYHNWQPDAGVVEITSYAARHDWLTRGRLIEIFAYPFDRVGCRMAVARIAENNRRTRRIWRALGARETLIPDLRGPGEAECVQTLAADDWRKSKFMRSIYGQAQSSEAA